MKYRKKPVVVEATQWFKNGDHPQVVRRFRCPDVPGDKVCRECGHPMHAHGWIEPPWPGYDGRTVCPGDWIIAWGKPKWYFPLKPDVFRDGYEPADEIEHTRAEMLEAEVAA